MDRPSGEPGRTAYSFGHTDTVMFRQEENRLEDCKLRMRLEVGWGDVQGTKLRSSWHINPYCGLYEANALSGMGLKFEAK